MIQKGEKAATGARLRLTVYYETEKGKLLWPYPQGL